MSGDVEDAYCNLSDGNNIAFAGSECKHNVQVAFIFTSGLVVFCALISVQSRKFGIATTGAENAARMALGPHSEAASAEELVPEELRKRVTVLSRKENNYEDVGKIFMLGTAHISREACHQVQELVDAVKPDCIFLELCEGRTIFLSPALHTSRQTLSDVIQNLRAGENPFTIFYTWAAEKITHEMGNVTFGAEMRAAVQCGSKYGAKAVLGDRPVDITVARGWGFLSPWQKLKLVCGLLWLGTKRKQDGVEQFLTDALDNETNLELLINQFAVSFPTFKVHLVDERDLCMLYHLRLCSLQFSSTVAVVGMGHSKGISRRWRDIESGKSGEITKEEVLAVMQMPLPPSLTERLLTTVLLIGVPTASIIIAIGAIVIAAQAAVRAILHALS